MSCADPRVSVVVLTFNRRDEVLATLAGLRGNLADAPSVPIIVVDNGSVDSTAQAIRQKFPDVTLVESPRNLGAAGRNLGVEKVHTPYVAFCDDDTCWQPGALQCAADILDEHPSVALVNARILVGPEKRTDTACASMADSPLGEVGGRRLLLGFMAGASVMRTQCYRAVGGYWPPFFIGGEETLLALDLAARGWQMVYAPEVLTRHWPSVNRNAGTRRHMLARNAIWTAWMRLPLHAAARESARTLMSIPSPRQRAQVLLAVLAGLLPVLQRRRVIPSDVQAMRNLLQRSSPAAKTLRQA